MANKSKANEFNKLEIKGKLTAKKNSEIKFTSKKVATIFETSVKPNSCGAYITIPQIYHKHKAFVVIMQEKVK